MNSDPEEEDDFGEFGGFEEADPAELHEAQAPEAQAPWLVFPGNPQVSSAQPDLIQARPHGQAISHTEFLSTPQEDILGARPLGTVPPSAAMPRKTYDPLVEPMQEPSLDDIIQQHQSAHYSGSPRNIPDLGQPFNGDSDPVTPAAPVAVCGDATECASGGGGTPGVLDVLDIGGRTTNAFSSRLQPDVASDADNPVDLCQGAAAASMPQLDLDLEGDGLYASADVASLVLGSGSDSGGLLSNDRESGISIPSSNELSYSKELHNGDLVAEVNGTDAGLLSEQHERQKLEKELKEVLAQQSQLEEMLVKCQRDLEAQKEKYQLIQTKHQEELKALQQAGHDSLAIIVEEYKELSRKAVLEEKESSESRLLSVLKEQSEMYDKHLQAQAEAFEAVFEEKKKSMEEHFVELLKEEQEKHKLGLEEALEKERNRMRQALDEALQEEQQQSIVKLETALADERKKTTAFMHQEQENLREAFNKERVKNNEVIGEEITKQVQESQKLIQDAIDEERSKSVEVLEEVKKQAKDDLQGYLKEQRKADHAQHQHKLAAADLFLDSARKQLALLMNDNNED